MKRGWTKWILLSATVGGLMAVVADGHAVVAQEKGGGDVTGVGTVENWPVPVHTDGWTWGSIPAVWAESEDRVLVFMRGRSRRCAKCPHEATSKGGRSASWKVSAPR